MSSSGMGALAGLMGVPGAGTSNESAMVLMLTNSDTVIDQIADEFDLLEIYKLGTSKFPKSELRTTIRQHLSVNTDLDTNTISIAYEDIDRILATKIVNRVVDILENKFAELDQTSNFSQRRIFEEKKSEVEVEISLIQQEILDFQNKYNIMDARAISETIGNRIVFLKTSLVEKEAALATYKTKTRIEDPSLIKLKDEKVALENSLWALENGTIEGIPALKDLPLIVMEYEELTRSLQVQATIYQSLIQQYEILKLQKGGTGPKFQIIEYAEVPEMKSGPSRGKLCVIVTFVAFFFSIFFAFLKEFWINLKNDPERMKKLKGIKID
ncbi:MAG: hypothetical protein JEY91_13510 [Spirochaetaceae bacterium]|nr:hypothetical protein [Spirochaetaceae bacterium]